MPDFTLPYKDESEYEAEMLQKLQEMVAARKAGQSPVEPEADDVSTQLAALRKVAGEPDYSGMDIGEQLGEDTVDPTVTDDLPGEPVLDEDKAAKLAAIQKYLAR